MSAVERASRRSRAAPTGCWTATRPTGPNCAGWVRTSPRRTACRSPPAARPAEPQDLLPPRAFGVRTGHPAADFEPEPLVAVLGTPGDTAADQIIAGQALQRVLLTATDAGLAVSLLSQPIEVPAAREQLRLALGRSGTPQMVMRVGYGKPGWPTPRRSIDEVIDGSDCAA